MDDPKQVLDQVIRLHEGLLEYRRLLASQQYEKADRIRSQLAILWGEIQEDVVELGVPVYWTAMGRAIPTFEAALSQFDPVFGSVFFDSIGHAITSAEIARGKLTRMVRQGQVPPKAERQVRQPRGTQIFVVHGHDHGYMEAVCRLLERLDLEPIVLFEKPDQGQTIIEKLEKHASVSYAIVILTPDDIGHPANSPEQAKPRARQNVILELGYFMGLLGRQNVCVLHAGDLELPSDISGLLYIPAESDAWRIRLATELRSAGFDVDLNRLAE